MPPDDQPQVTASSTTSSETRHPITASDGRPEGPGGKAARPPGDAPRDQTFFEVFREETEVINERRIAVAEGKLALDRGAKPAPDQGKMSEEDKEALRVRVETHQEGEGAEAQSRTDERNHLIARLRPGHNLTGLSLSGGGIRSAAFCLGVLQGIDAVREDTEPQVLDQIDYLSTVSGGGYIGASLVSGLMEAEGKFPFASKLDQQETIETQHLRDHSNFLFPSGVRDYVAGIIAVSRGLLINLMVFAAVIVLGAAATVLVLPLIGMAGAWLLDLTRWPREGRISGFGWTFAFIGFLMVCQILVAIGSSLFERKWSLERRETISKYLSRVLLVVVGAAAIELIGYAIKEVGDPSGLVGAPSARVVPAAMTPAGAEKPKAMLDLLSSRFSVVPLVLLILFVALVVGGLAGKITAVARTTAGDETWRGSLKRWGSWATLYVAAAIVPLLLLFIYIAFCYWGFRSGDADVYALDRDKRGLPEWLMFSMNVIGKPEKIAETISPALVVYAIVGTLCLGASFLVRPNVGSLHGFYRDRLSRAFLWNRKRLVDEANGVGASIVWRENLQDEIRPSGNGRRDQRHPTTVATATPVPSDTADHPVDERPFSHLKKRIAGGWDPDVRFAPYLLVNTAVNLGMSPYLKRRGRKADSFVFSPLYMGSEATGYVASSMMEKIDKGINIGTAMAISGAAASANMGSGTIKPLTFSLAVLNVRLGYWVRNPRFVPTWKETASTWDNVGPVYYALETFGKLSEETRNVYLTDGGHFDNLGLYELLKRRCRLIIAVDSEADPNMNFASFIRVQRYARIDLGVRIDMPWEHLRRTARAIGNNGWERPIVATDCQGPHVAVGYIHYGRTERGVLIYVKASLSGDESDLITDYKRRYRDYPHETTLDQFFSEEQFEVYRALGFHAAKGFFNGVDDFDMFPADQYRTWIRDLADALDHINVPIDARDRIIARALKGPRGKYRGIDNSTPEALGRGGLRRRNAAT